MASIFTLTGNTANYNNNRGIFLTSSSNNILTGNTADNNIASTPNSGFGIYLISSSNNNIFTGNTASSNSYQGIRIESSSNNDITSNTANNNGNGGIVLISASNNNALTRNTANNNNIGGIALAYSSSSNVLTNNTASSNNWYGIVLVSSSDNNFTNNVLSSSGIADFYSASSSGNIITNMTFNGSSYPTTASFVYNGNIQVNSANAISSLGFYNVSKYLNVTNQSAAWVLLNISYSDTIHEHDLKMYKYNGASWILANATSPLNGVDTANKVVYANITSFSVFAPLAAAVTPPITSAGGGARHRITNVTNVTLPAPTPVCQENWQCIEFSECVNGSQTRTCSDLNDCGTTAQKPALTQSCEAPAPSKAPSKESVFSRLFKGIGNYMKWAYLQWGVWIALAAVIVVIIRDFLIMKRIKKHYVEHYDHKIHMKNFKQAFPEITG